MTALSRLTNEALIGSLRSLVSRSNGLEAEIIGHIQEVETRGLHLDAGYSSLFAFCTGELGFAEGAAYNRIEVARAARRVPAMLDALRGGEVHLSGLRLLAPHLTEANHRDVLARAKCKSKRQIEELVAELAPRPPVPDAIRRLPEKKQAKVTPIGPTPPAGAPAPVQPLSTPPGAQPSLWASSASPARPTAPGVSAPPRAQPGLWAIATTPVPATAATSGAQPSSPETSAAPVQPTTARGVSTPPGAQPTLLAAGAALAAGAWRGLSATGAAPVPPAGAHLGSSSTRAQPGHATVQAEAAQTVSAGEGALSGSPATRAVPVPTRRYAVRFTAGEGLKDKLRRAQDLLRHQIPGGELDRIVERALDLLIAKVEKDRFGVGARARSSEPRARPATGTRASRHVPAEIRRAVYERDGGRCAYVSEQGHRCEETSGLELDHLDGFARTGVHEVERMRLACRAHNSRAAEMMYGGAFMARSRLRRHRPRMSSLPSHGARTPSTP